MKFTPEQSQWIKRSHIEERKYHEARRKQAVRRLIDMRSN